MSNYLRLINGIPTTQGLSLNLYEDDYVIASPLSSGTPITLPGGQTYTDSELKVFVDGKRQYPTYDYNYEGSAPRTQISFTYNQAANTVVLFEITSLSITYQQTYSVGSLISSGTPITLPASGSYTNTELKIYVDGKRNFVTYDYNYEGSIPRTQVSFTYDLAAGTIILFEKE
jgi:hypothetical protein